MTEAEIYKAVAPCSLLCHTCFGYEHSAVRYHAKKLFELYRGWYSGHYHAYMPEPNSVQRARLDAIQSFNEMLKGLYEGEACTGCHNCEGDCPGCIPGCVIPACTREHGVGFCGDCPDFPCDKAIPENIRQMWLDGSAYIKEHGYLDFFETHKDIAHFMHCYDKELED